MSKKPKYHIPQNAMIVSLIDDLSNIVFAEDAEEKEMYLSSLEFKLTFLLPSTLETERKKFICMIIQLIASYTDLEFIEIKAMQRQIFIGCDDAKKLNVRSYKHNEKDLKDFVERFILPILFNMGIDIKLEFAELEGLRTQLQRDN